MNDNALELSTGGSPGGPPGGVGEFGAFLRLLSDSRLAAWAVVDDLVTTVFPGDCRTCGGALLRAGVVPVCEACVERVPRQSAVMGMALCDCCGEALDMDGARFAGRGVSAVGGLAEGLLCAPCRMVAPEFAQAVAYGVYEDELREMVHLLKYERMREVAGLLGPMLAESILTLESAAAREMVVVAVPLFPGKERQRGYNQAVLLADAALGSLRRARPGWRLEAQHGALRRVRDTESQFALTPKGRRRNLQGAFAMAKDAALIGREVLLVDDIYTTGATARECARVLRRAGARKVWVATVSRAQKEFVEFWSGSF